MERNTIRILVALAIVLAGIILWQGRKAQNATNLPTTQGNMNKMPDTYDQQEPDEISASLQVADAERLSQFFDEEISFTVKDNDELLTAAEARDQLKEFFEAHPSEGFRILHRGKSGTGKSSYLIGNHRTTQGTYRFYLSLEGEKITEIRIE